MIWAWILGEYRAKSKNNNEINNFICWCRRLILFWMYVEMRGSFFTIPYAEANIWFLCFFHDKIFSCKRFRIIFKGGVFRFLANFSSLIFLRKINSYLAPVFPWLTLKWNSIYEKKHIHFIGFFSSFIFLVFIWVNGSMCHV